MEKALFLDRDGVICKMIFYPNIALYDSPQKLEDVVLVEEIIDVIKWANQHEILVIEISNQPGVAKGKIDMESLEVIEARVHDLMQQSGVAIEHVYRCLHHPLGIVPELTLECDCRKPKPGLLLQAAKELNIDLSQSVFLGDNASDVEAGKNAGCKTIIYLHGEDVPEKVEKAKMSNADYKVDTIEEVVPIIKQIFVI